MLKIYILINVISASRKGTKPAIKFMGKNGKLTTSLADAKVYSDNLPMPKEVSELYDSCKYGYAELML